MTKLTKEAFVESLKEMSIKEVMKLVEAMKEKCGVDPAAAVAVATAPGETAEAAKSSVKVVLNAVNGKKVLIIKAVKDLLGGSLMDAKKIV
ncbi:50S ribosomal protein L7/L12, partial [Mycoplasmopsis synoviae]|uniref:50S ribosomal protein L7/L12 n=1 Tax=Mycoplasmopsis synoviae TaxID=2109 RepID=UPI00387AF365